MFKGLLPVTSQRAGITTNGALVNIPYRRPDGSLFRVRHVMGDKRWWGPGSGMLPYGLETLPNGFVARNACLCITEGESDALALRETLGEYCAAVFCLGCPGATAWKEEWEVYLDAFRFVVVLGDGDEAGDLFTRRVQSSYPRAVGACMPVGKDVRSVVQGESADVVLEIVKECVELEAMVRKHFPWDGRQRATVEREVPAEEQTTIDMDGEAVPVTPIRRDSL